MDRTKVFLTGFALLVLVQLFVPIKMIMDKESVLKNGKEYLFKTAPVDPNDPFRGKYITLSFEEDIVELNEADEFFRRDVVYGMLEIDSSGFARVKSISKEKPINASQDYLKLEIAYVTAAEPREARLIFPFNRFYMEESKAYDAELAYNETQSDSSEICYALVNVLNGQSVLKDVMINGRSIISIAADRKPK